MCDNSCKYCMHSIYYNNICFTIVCSIKHTIYIYQSTKNTIGNSDIHYDYVFNKNFFYLMMVTVQVNWSFPKLMAFNIFSIIFK